jgi:hypothetical protein
MPRPCFSPGDRTPDIHWAGGWVGPRACLYTETRWKILFPLPGIEPWSPGRPVHSQSLYWLSYSGLVKSFYLPCITHIQLHRVRCEWIVIFIFSIICRWYLYFVLCTFVRVEPFWSSSATFCFWINIVCVDDVNVHLFFLLF